MVTHEPLAVMEPGRGRRGVSGEGEGRSRADVPSAESEACQSSPPLLVRTIRGEPYLRVRVRRLKAMQLPKVIILRWLVEAKIGDDRGRQVHIRNHVWLAAEMMHAPR